MTHSRQVLHRYATMTYHIDTWYGVRCQYNHFRLDAGRLRERVMDGGTRALLAVGRGGCHGGKEVAEVGCWAIEFMEDEWRD